MLWAVWCTAKLCHVETKEGIVPLSIHSKIFSRCFVPDFDSQSRMRACEYIEEQSTSKDNVTKWWSRILVEIWVPCTQALRPSWGDITWHLGSRFMLREGDTKNTSRTRSPLKLYWEWVRLHPTHIGWMIFLNEQVSRVGVDLMSVVDVSLKPQSPWGTLADVARTVCTHMVLMRANQLETAEIFLLDQHHSPVLHSGQLSQREIWRSSTFM